MPRASRTAAAIDSPQKHENMGATLPSNQLLSLWATDHLEAADFSSAQRSAIGSAIANAIRQNNAQWEQQLKKAGIKFG